MLCVNAKQRCREQMHPHSRAKCITAIRSVFFANLSFNREKIMSNKLSFVSVFLGVITLTLIATISSLSAETSVNLVAPGATIQKTSGFTSTEGPATDADGNVWFTEVFASRIQKWNWEDGKTTLYRENTGTANGMMFDAKGNLVICEMGNGRIVRDDLKGHVTVIADSMNGKKFRGPNDLWIDPKGGIYFSHTSMGAMPPGGMPGEAPPSGMQGGAPPSGEMPASGGMPEGMGGAPGGPPSAGGDTSDLGIVYISPDGKNVSLVTTDVTNPNGLIGTPDGKILYVGDGKKVFSYKINSDGSLSDKKLFCESGTDGMAMDEHNDVYLTDDKDILIYSPAGELLQKIETPDGCSNVEFCGKDRKTLFFTYHDNIYTLKMNVRGGRLPIDSLKKGN